MTAVITPSTLHSELHLLHASVGFLWVQKPIHRLHGSATAAQYESGNVGPPEIATASSYLRPSTRNELLTPEGHDSLGILGCPFRAQCPSGRHPRWCVS